MSLDRVLAEAEEKALVALRDRQTNYRLALGGPPGQAVLDDLARFCRADETTFHPDPRVHALMEGRREVWLRINEYLNLTPEDLLRRRTNVE